VDVVAGSPYPPAVYQASEPKDTEETVQVQEPDVDEIPHPQGYYYNPGYNHYYPQAPQAQQQEYDYYQQVAQAAVTQASQEYYGYFSGYGQGTESAALQDAPLYPPKATDTK